MGSTWKERALAGNKGPGIKMTSSKKAQRGLVIAGLAGGSGKSVLAVGVAAALARRGVHLVPFKKGPDYIDAGWLAIGAGHRCYNLDPYLMSVEAIQNSFATHGQGAELLLVEGNRGLFDGVSADGEYSTAELAKMLHLPILLVVNCTKTTRTVAALVLGCQQFDRDVTISGVILNQVATERQRKVITEAVEKYTGIPVIGAIPRLKRDIFPMRHLGMIPHQEYIGSNEALDFLADLVVNHVDLDKVCEAAEELDVQKHGAPVQTAAVVAEQAADSVVIGVLQDAAFQFYYAENLESLERAGARLVYLDAMRDTELPDELDGLYIGGGFPETGAAQLAANKSFRDSVKRAADNDLPIYAECGGLIYLGTSICVGEQDYPLVDIFPVRFAMSDKPQAHGYTVLAAEAPNPFYDRGVTIKGHEFRYSRVVAWGGNDSQLAFKVKRGHGFMHGRDGLVYKNVLALYTHVHADGTPEWAAGFIARCRLVGCAHRGRDLPGMVT
jgi:cobyrinic acid a,c-diamide synthase